MAQAIAATVPSEVAAKKLAEWLSKIIHRVNVATTGNQWSIFVPEAALSRARRALREVIVAANPPPRPGGSCCKALGKGAPCAKCGKHAHFTVDWLIPARVVDSRPACSSSCAAALKRAPAKNKQRLARRRTFSSDHRIMSEVGNLIQQGQLEEAADIIEQRTGRRPSPGTLRAKYSGMTMGGEPSSIHYRNNQGEKRYNVWAYNRLTGGSFALERNVPAKTAVWAYRKATKQGLRPWCIDLETQNQVHPTRSGVLKNPVNKRARREAKRREQRVKEDLGLSGRPLAKRTRWTGRTDAYGQGQRAGSGYVRFWLWNDREWKLNLRSSYEGVSGEPSLRESARGYADDEAEKNGIAKKWPGQVGKWKAGFILAFEEAIAAAFGTRREFDDFGEDKSQDQANRLRRRRSEHWKKFAGKNPSAESSWARLTAKARIHALQFAGFEWSAAERYATTRWGLLPRVYRDRLTNSWETRADRGTTRRLQAVHNPSSAVRQAREAKVKMLLIRIKAILQAGEQKLRSGRREEARESIVRVEALWDKMPKGVAMVSPRTRREAFELSQRGVRLRNGQVRFNKSRAGRNTGERYLIQGIRPKHRNWVTIDVAHDLNRALLNALHRARLGNVTYRVWDTETVEEVWRGTGQAATIEGWKATRPSGLVGANRRTAMHRNPRISPRMQKLRENTMRLGDAMKWGRRLLDAGVRIHLWDGSGWEVDIRPNDAYATSSGRAATGGRAYLAKGAGLIKTWPITLLAPEMKPGFWLTPAAISHYLQHRKMGVASNPGCASILCNPWYYGYKKGGGVEKFHARRKPTEASHGRRYGAVVGPFKKPGDMDKMYGFGWQAGPHTIVRRGKVTAARNAGETLAELDRQFYAVQDELKAMDKAGLGKSKEYMDKLLALSALSKRRLAVSGITIGSLQKNVRSNPAQALKQHLSIGDRVQLVNTRFAGSGTMPTKYAHGSHVMSPPVRELEKGDTLRNAVMKGEVGVVTAVHRWPWQFNYVVKFGRKGYSILGAKHLKRLTTNKNSDTVAENLRIAHEQIVGAFLAGKKRSFGSSSQQSGTRYWTDGNLLRVWGNLVAAKVPGGVEIKDAGYRTLLTKNVLNTILRHLGAGSIYQKARQWYISTPQGNVEWTGSRDHSHGGRRQPWTPGPQERPW